MFESCIRKQQLAKSEFEGCADAEARYDRIIALGKDLPPVGDKDRIPEHRVEGCQSEMYLRSWLEDGRIRFAVASDALISRGLASLLVRVYDGELPEVVVRCPPTFIKELGIPGSLTPGRAMGLASLHRRMVHDAIKLMAAA
jgi:cysteine desulfuration protein SufE